MNIESRRKRRLPALLAVLVASALAGSGVAIAAGDTGGNDMNRTNANAPAGNAKSTSTAGNTTTAANAPAANAPNRSQTSGSAASHRDKSFVTKASEAGMAEVEMAKVAQSKASSSQVKDFASHMVSDHQKANDELMRIAGSKGITPSSSLSSKDQRELSKLQSLSGADFDREYVKSQVSAHKDAVSLFDGESRHGNDADLKQFAGSTLPTLKSHKEMVDNLAKAPAKTASQ